jgi:Lrp/AsnC family leucine-responsive transcriptional regulator
VSELLDKLDRALLAQLLQNARAPTTKLAKACRTSREVIAYRLKRLQDCGIIRAFLTDVDAAALGYCGAAVFFATRPERDKELRLRLANDLSITWVGEHVGIWDFGMSIYGKDAADVEERFLRFHKEFSDVMLDHRFTFHKRNHYESLERKPRPLGRG